MIRWHRKGFRLYWRALSRRGPGRPRVPQEVRELIRRLAFENGWRARKIQGELSKLGFTISLATVSRYLPKRLPDPGRRQRWTTFLRNHKDAIAAWAWQGNPYLGAVVGAAMAINTLIAVSLGGVVPLLLRRLRVDPALASGPILTTVTDMCGFALVLGIATACLPLLTHS